MNLKLIKKLCTLNKHQLEQILIKYLYSKNYKQIIHTDSYVIAEGDIPICLIAHMDTVFMTLPNASEFYYDAKQKVLWNPAGSGFDDRAGIYAILQILEHGYRPHIIFTDLEEKGGIGSSALIKKYPNCPFNTCSCLIQLDRANKDDMVFYDCDNEAFVDYIGDFGFKEAFGSFSDISILAPAWGIAAVNLSVGYIDEHRAIEHLHCDWCDATIKKVEKILAKADNMPSFIYIPYTPIRMYDKLSVLCESPFDDDEEEEYRKWLEGDLLSDKCAICGDVIKHKKYIIETTNPYIVCSQCFNDYYSKDDVQFTCIKA